MSLREFFLSRIHSFRHAFRGWGYVLRTQHNAWIHAAFTFAVILLALWLGLPARDWAVLILAIAIVWAAEFLNSALEVVVDLASPQRHRLAGIGKDVAAGAVLIAALSSVVIGLLILGPPLWARLQVLFERP